MHEYMQVLESAVFTSYLSLMSSMIVGMNVFITSVSVHPAYFRKCHGNLRTVSKDMQVDQFIGNEG